MKSEGYGQLVALTIQLLSSHKNMRNFARANIHRAVNATLVGYQRENEPRCTSVRIPSANFVRIRSANCGLDLAGDVADQPAENHLEPALSGSGRERERFNP